jgi:hypothetical protein
VDEHVDEFSAEPEQPHAEADHGDDGQRQLTQRELVRASLLRCPPQRPADQAQR